MCRIPTVREQKTINNLCFTRSGIAFTSSFELTFAIAARIYIHLCTCTSRDFFVVQVDTILAAHRLTRTIERTQQQHLFGLFTFDCNGKFPDETSMQSQSETVEIHHRLPTAFEECTLELLYTSMDRRACNKNKFGISGHDAREKSKQFLAIKVCWF